jgi:Ni/Co efflux regulator RcnB
MGGQANGQLQQGTGRYHGNAGGQANGQLQQGTGRYHGNAGGQANGQVQQWNGRRGGAGFNGQANGEVPHWNSRRDGAGFNGQANGQVQQWNGQRGGAGFAGRTGVRAGFGFQQHGLRGRDQGRGYFSANSFARRYHAERRFRFGGYRYRPNGWYFRTWNYGDFLPTGWFGSDYYLDWADYGLPPPPVGCEWIAQGPDAVLVDVWTGEVLSVYSGVFYWNG